MSLEDAAEWAGISITEAKLIQADDVANPPPAEAFLPIGAPTTEKETDMAGKAKPKNDDVEIIAKPDFERAVRIYKQDIRPAQAKVGEYAQEQSTAYKEIKKGCNVHPGAAKLAFKLDTMEDTKRDDFLRSLWGLMSELNIGISADLVDQMGDGEAPDMPVAAAKKPIELVTTSPLN